MCPIVIAVLGDSLSLPLKRDMRYREALIDARDMLVPYRDTFPALMQMLFGQALGTPVLIASQTQRGATTVELLELALTALREYQPHYSIVNIGTSDARFRPTGLRRVGGTLWQKVALPEFERNLSRLLPALAFSRTVPITIGILPCSTELLRKYPDTAREFARYNAVLKRFTVAAGGIFLDMNDLAECIDEYVAPDGFHYSGKTHWHVAHRILETIQQDLSSRRSGG